MRAHVWLAAAALLLIAAAAAFLLWAREPAIAAIAPPSPRSFAAEQVAAGEALARVGNCLSCHQAAHGPPYAGGFPVRTPFGTIYGSNLTPDPETGIGRWSLPAFSRALRQGIGRDGRQLYPALPYEHFAGLRDGDVAALYAFLMTRTPVRATPPANRLVPPLGFRPLIAGWKLLFFHPAPIPVDAAHDATWNRGRYLGEALAHCGGCHTPRNVAGAERRGHAYDGGWSDGWYAPPLNARSPAVRAWTADRLDTYLSTGLGREHAAAAGPMGAVTRNLSLAPPGATRALATYYAGLMADAPASRREPPLPDRRAAATAAHPQGATLFAGACATCHAEGAPMMRDAGRPALALGTPLHEANPRDTIQIILQGLAPPVGWPGPYMPAFADTFTDAQLEALVAYLRARYGTGPAWTDLQNAVTQARKDGAK